MSRQPSNSFGKHKTFHKIYIRHYHASLLPYTFGTYSQWWMRRGIEGNASPNGSGTYRFARPQWQTLKLEISQIGLLNIQEIYALK